ncbi:MAG TPA: hypothetical protein VGV89_03415 [Thermoplasmata archaeon]|nr:hypothetical protein [Thermoplasmata archaeon]
MNETAPTATRGSIPRGRKSLLVFAAVAAAAGLIVLVVAMQTPTPTTHSTTVVRDSAIALNGGLANAVYFPFEINAAPGVSGQASAGNFTTLDGTVAVVGCTATTACPTVVVEVVSASSLGTLRSTGQVSPVWCTENSAGACAATTSSVFHVDVTPEAGQMLDLVVYSPASASTSMTLSATVSLDWTTT